METGADVSVFVDCVVRVLDAVATDVVVAFVVVEDVQPAIRRPQSKRLSRTRDVRMESMFFSRMTSRFFLFVIASSDRMPSHIVAYPHNWWREVCETMGLSNLSKIVFPPCRILFLSSTIISSMDIGGLRSAA